MSTMPETIKLTIDGETIEVPKGTTVLTAAGFLGRDVPRYCYHPGLTIAGNCRICIVEIEKFPKLATSCTTVAAEGMVVKTGGGKVEDGRRAVMEFLLANHPLDCPICDQAGECRLQEYSFQHGQGGSRFQEVKIKGFKQKPVGPHVVLDTERCIVCTRCVRFCQEVTGTGELGVFQRGAHSYIDTFPGMPLDNAYSGNTVDICPVGALTLSEFRFRKRVWELKDVSSVCGTCARGCNVNLGTAGDRIWRLTPRENQAVNKWWMCDEGRLSYLAVEGSARLTHPRARPDASSSGDDDAILWPQALDRLAARLKQAGPKKVVVVASASLTLEDLWGVKRLVAEKIEGGEIIVPERRRGADDAILIRADKSANAAGAALLDLAIDTGNRRLAAALASAKDGQVDSILLLGADALPDGPADPAMTAALAAAGRRAFVCAFTPFDVPAMRSAADLHLPAVAYGEFEGTWVNFEGRAQRVRRAVTPKFPAMEGWRLAAELITRMGGEAHWGSATEVLGEIAAAVPRLKEISPRAIGPQGVAL